MGRQDPASPPARSPATTPEARKSGKLAAALPFAVPPRSAVDPTRATITLAPIPTSTNFAPLLEAHLGMVVGACAGAIAEALGQFQNGGLTTATKGQSGKFIAELFRLRQYMIVDWPEFDTLAKERGVEALCACDFDPATANMLVDAVLEILGKIVR